MRRCFIGVYSAGSGIPGSSLTNDFIKPDPWTLCCHAQFIHPVLLAGFHLGFFYLGGWEIVCED